MLCADEGSGEEDEGRLDQQMGDAGEQAEAVDERLWKEGDDKQEGQVRGWGFGVLGSCWG